MEDPIVLGAVMSLGFVVFFALIWFFVTKIIVRMAGWPALVQNFPDQPHVRANEKWSAATAAIGRSAIGGVNFRNSLVVEACDTGLRIKIWRILAPSAEPIFIPWSQLGSEEGILGTTLLPLGNPEKGCFRVRTKFARKIEAVSRGQFKISDD